MGKRLYSLLSLIISLIIIVIILFSGCDIRIYNPFQETTLINSDNQTPILIRVTNNTGDSITPSLVWTGTVFGVSWHDARDGNYEVYFARIDSSGTKIGNDARITNESSDSDITNLVWTGNGYGVSWQDIRDGNNEIYFTEIDSGGTKIGSDVRITNDNAYSCNSDSVWAVTRWCVSWEDDRDGNFEIYFQIF